MAIGRALRWAWEVPSQGLVKGLGLGPGLIRASSDGITPREITRACVRACVYVCWETDLTKSRDIVA